MKCDACREDFPEDKLIDFRARLTNKVIGRLCDNCFDIAYTVMRANYKYTKFDINLEAWLYKKLVKHVRSCVIIEGIK